METKNLKIGITLGLKSNTESIWTNGIKQNVLMMGCIKEIMKNLSITLKQTY